MVSDLQQLYYCTLEALSFVPFIFAITFGSGPYQALTLAFFWDTLYIVHHLVCKDHTARVLHPVCKR